MHFVFFVSITVGVRIESAIGFFQNNPSPTSQDLERTRAISRQAHTGNSYKCHKKRKKKNQHL